MSEPTEGREGVPALAGAYAFAVLSAHRDALRAELGALGEADDPEARHRVRVAVRRLRAGLVVFDGALPARAPLHRARLDRIGSALGPVRDLDVLTARIVEWRATVAPEETAAWDVLVAAIDRRRVRAGRRAAAELGRVRTVRTLAMLDAFLARGPLRSGRAARLRMVDLAPELLEREMTRLVDAGGAALASEEPAALHALRIRCKRLRHLIEFLEPLHGRPARRYLKRLVALQDLLGSHQDAVAAADAIGAIALGARPRLPARTVLLAGVLVERCEASARADRARLADRFAAVTGRRWRRLVVAAEDARAT